MFKKVRDFIKNKTGENIILNIGKDLDLNNNNNNNDNNDKDYITMKLAGTSSREKEIKKLYEHMAKSHDCYLSYTDPEIIEIFSFSNCEEIYTRFGSYDKVYELSRTNCLYPVKLIPDPGDEYGPDTLKVTAILDNEELLLGYIPKINKPDILKKYNDLISAEVFPLGGKYKYAVIDRSELIVKMGEEPYSLGLKVTINNN